MTGSQLKFQFCSVFPPSTLREDTRRELSTVLQIVPSFELHSIFKRTKQHGFNSEEIEQSLTSLLTRANIFGFGAAEYISKLGKNAGVLPDIVVAILGGGYKAILKGARFIAAADI